ncbi:hypothetical protein MTO96_046006 [Rhipicephalus appendiculatus]
MNVLIGLSLVLVKILTNVLTLLSLPFYVVFQPPRNILKKSRACLARRVEQDRYAPYWRPSRDVDACVGVLTLDELARKAIAKWPLQRCLGSRPILHRTEKIEVGTDKIVKKSTLGEYRWLTYHEVDRKVERISRGLLLSGVGCGQCLAILAETSQEWFLMAQACFRINAPLLTLRTSMGDVGIICAMNETSATHLVTSDELLPRVRRLVRRIPSLRIIVCIETADTRLDVRQGEEPRVVPFSSLERLSADVLEDGAAPTPDDVAVVAYTSGPHGAPRGVVATHRNIVAAINGLGAVRRAYCGDEDIYIAYLQLAHVFELVAELLAFGTGTPIGYSSATTLTDASTGLAEGCKGRLCEALLEYAVDYKTSWSECGFETPLLDSFIFNSLRSVLGSRLRVIVCGSAPLSTRTRRFAQACLCCHVIETYGTTETCAVGAIQDIEDNNMGRVGAAVPGTYVRLIDWPEGSYYVTDRPNPRGEIIVGGPCVAQGYFKRKVLTRAAFRYEAGVRWFFTGDIAEIFPDGTLKILDSRNQQVKLQSGECAWLGLVEEVLRMCPLVHNVLAYGSPKYAYLVALVEPNYSQLQCLARSIGRSRYGRLTLKQLCEDDHVTKAATRVIKKFARESGKLQRSEVPLKVKLCADKWGPDKGLVTASFKICRKPLEEYYKSDIRALYGTTEQCVQTPA